MIIRKLGYPNRHVPGQWVKEYEAPGKLKGEYVKTKSKAISCLDTALPAPIVPFTATSCAPCFSFQFDQPSWLIPSIRT